MNLPTLNRCLLPFKQPLDQLGMKGTNRLCTRALNYQELIIRSIVPGGGGAAPAPAPQEPPVTASSFLAGCREGRRRLHGEGVASVCACMCTWLACRLSMRAGASGASASGAHPVLLLCVHMTRLCGRRVHVGRGLESRVQVLHALSTVCICPILYVVCARVMLFVCSMCVCGFRVHSMNVMWDGGEGSASDGVSPH